MTYDIVIVGAGIAGLTTAIYGKRADKNVLVLESHSYGGQIVTTPKIENYPATPGISGFDFATKIYEQAINLGTSIKFEDVLSVINGSTKTVVTNQNQYQTKTVILATGSKSRLLGLPNEQKFLGHGVSYCATCDGNFFKNQIVAVVGGGNTALSDVLYLANLAQKVYLIHRRENFNAEAALVAQIQNQPKIEIIHNAQIIGLVGEKHLTDITIQVAANTRQIAVNGLFVAIGRVPENIKFTNVVKLDPAGYIIAGEDCCTATPGIFVAGDCRTKTVRQLVTAAADGAVSANQAIKYLNHAD